MIDVAAFVLGITQVVKDLGYIPNKFLPLVAIVVGAVANPVILARISDPMAYVEGVAIGLGTTGVYSVADGFAKKVK
ncbi:MAG: hypothetical protein GY861_18370 [bacterium]|nr:hypothetical protein [bacterium]